MPLFGDENALHDTALYDCFVMPHDAVVDKPIMLGEWGTGKSAIVLERNKNLDDCLAEIDQNLHQYWYITEQDLNANDILEILEKHGGNERALIRALENFWFVEIVRRFCKLLTILRPTYTNVSGPHWETLETVANFDEYTDPLGRILRRLLEIFLETDKHENVRKLRSEIEFIQKNSVLDEIRHCLRDIAGEKVQPVVAVEPVDTPYSDLGKVESAAQCMTDSLLNIFRIHFHSFDETEMKVYLCVPMNRYRPERLAAPQRFPQYINRCQWSRTSLRTFINERIKWEYQRVRRRFSPTRTSDHWDSLFGHDIQNEHCRGKILEDTFDYVLRHTHYRPRDLQRIARKIVEYQATKWGPGVTVDDVVRGSGGRRIDARQIRAALNRVSREIAELRVMESGQFNPRIHELIHRLKGLPVPCVRSELEKHIGSTKDFWEDCQNLWDWNILGIELSPADEDKCEMLKRNFGRSPWKVCREREKNTFYEKWFIYSYNSGGSIDGIYNAYNSRSGIKLEFILHPMFFESLHAIVNRDYPVGA